MLDPGLVEWLASATELGMLRRDILESVASELEVLIVPAGERVTVEDTPVNSLYLLESGQAERYRRQQPGLMWASGLLPGAVVNLSAWQRSQLTDSRVVTLTLRLILRLPRQMRPQRVTRTVRSWNGYSGSRGGSYGRAEGV